jgi:hypothetical protein
MVDWKVAKRQAACSGCRRVFEEGEAHVSALTASGEDLVRDDQCLACWKKREHRDALLWWRTRHLGEKKRGIALDLEALEALFVALEGRREVALEELRYVLCLILMRKRRLRIDRVERDGDREELIVTRPKREGTFTVAVFDFDPAKIDEMRRRLQEVFEGAESPELAGGAAAEPSSPPTDA